MAYTVINACLCLILLILVQAIASLVSCCVVSALQIMKVIKVFIITLHDWVSRGEIALI